MNFDTKLTGKESFAPWSLCAGQIAHSIHYIEFLWDPEPFAIVSPRERFLNIAGTEPRFVGLHVTVVFYIYIPFIPIYLCERSVHM